MQIHIFITFFDAEIVSENDLLKVISDIYNNFIRYLIFLELKKYNICKIILYLQTSLLTWHILFQVVLVSPA